ncbi:unknown [Rickettsia felis URRWXCal2]|uniref:Uncharacterized protein n=1 Tax=Rickettsia felis (strain ATCC VR-1525 / URRWXCal2) TaxID=315456 RepID=Q4UNJ1_RICFE|nr:unknown [Rickettsia felis URRWXCal2]
MSRNKNAFLIGSNFNSGNIGIIKSIPAFSLLLPCTNMKEPS